MREVPGSTPGQALDGELAQMIERPLRMREAPGSTPGFSIRKKNSFLASEDARNAKRKRPTHFDRVGKSLIFAWEVVVACFGESLIWRAGRWHGHNNFFVVNNLS